ncbi:MAG TPA: cellulose binding domain-containing protein [Thermaerobacter sp.]
MSTDETGHVPPDHQQTAEFRVRNDGPTGSDAGEAEVTMTDPPSDEEEASRTRADSAEETVADAPAERVEDPAPQDAPAKAGPWTEQFGSEEARREEEEEATAPHPSLAKNTPPAASVVVQAAQRPEESSAASSSASPPAAQPASPPPSSGGATPPGGVPSAPPVAPAASAHPAPPSPPGGPATPGNARSGRPPKALLLTAGAVALVLVVAVVLGLAARPGGDDGTAAPRPTNGTASAAPPDESAAPDPGTPPGADPAPTEAPTAEAPEPGAPPSQDAPPSQAAPPRAPIGPVMTGDGLTYRLVQQDPGYFEGLIVITNRGSAPITNWSLTFQVPGANVKNIWGGRLVRGGADVEIRNLDGAPALQPGATWEVRFGAEGTPTQPRYCLFNGRSCGFR